MLTFVFVLAAIYPEIIFSQKQLFVKNGEENYSIGKYISIFEDKENKLGIVEASSDSIKNKYVYHYMETLNLRFTNSTFWIRFVVVDTLKDTASVIAVPQNGRTWVLIKNEPTIEDIRLYYRDLNAGGNNYIEKKAGSAVPVSDKTIKMYDFIASFLVQKTVPDTVYLRVQTRAQFILSFNMLTIGEYAIHSSKRNFFHGILFGVFILLMAYNILLYFSIKENVYILYVLYIFCYTLFLFTYEGYYFDIIGRTFHHDYFILPMGASSLGGVFWLLLTREFLSTKLNLPWAYKLLTYFTPIVPIIFICTFTFTTPWLSSVWGICLLGYYLLGFVIAVVLLKKGVYLSRYYILSVSGMVLGIMLINSTRNGYLPLPYNFWTRNSIHLGILWEAVVLAATVGYRFNFLKAEKEREKSLMRNQIASDLHDEIGSNLSTISLQSQLMMKNQLLDNDVKERLQNIADTARMTTDKIRDIVWFINPFHDKSEDLVLRMKELTSKMLYRLKYTFKSDGNDMHIFDLLPDLNMRRHIFLIYKETLNNVIKHSEATEVNILLTAKEKKFIMIVADNGKGFNEEKIVLGAGLNNLRNRAALIGAQILIESNGGQGMKIILEIPLKD